MPWTLNTIEPLATGLNYTTLVHHPAGYVADASPMVAVNTAPNTFTLYYKASPAASAGTDAWDTTIRFTDRDPHTVTIKAVIRKPGSTSGSETPEVADGAGGGGGTSGKISFKSVVTKSRTWPR